MDKLRKLGQWSLRNMARLVLGVLVLVLAYRVVEVVRQNPEEPKNFTGPTRTDPDPGDVPKAPTRYIEASSKEHSGLYVKNPFWAFSKRNEGKNSANTTDAAGENIQLLGIQKTPQGDYTAWIKTQATKWYKEGDQFETYRLQKIDYANKQVQVYSSKLARTITLKMQTSG